jgi:hypothetical protein
MNVQTQVFISLPSIGERSHGLYRKRDGGRSEKPRDRPGEKSIRQRHPRRAEALDAFEKSVLEDAATAA